MKKEYNTPEIEIINVEEILTASSFGDPKPDGYEFDDFGFNNN